MDTAVYQTPIGTLLAVFDGAVLVALSVSEDASAPSGCETAASAALGEALAQYFVGCSRALETIPIRTAGTPFQTAVWEALQHIPFGSVKTYGEIAAHIGRPGAARAVGRACHQNPILLRIPCHRVTAACGPGGFVCGSERKAWLLRSERHTHSNSDMQLPDTKRQN